MEAILLQAQQLATRVAETAGEAEPIRTVVPVANRMRPGTEEQRSALAETGQLLKSAPAIKGNYFKVASILE
jgi:aspartyl-tRNA synthetase